MSIDYVVPMVFPDDAEWRNDLCHAGRGGDERSCRYRSWGLEPLLIECIRTFMPWVRTIHILLARESQVQPWMVDNSGGRIITVFHDEFIPAEYLPTFNSRTIEMFLHRIPGLSDHFIYGNDDMIPLSPLAPEDFFRDGVPCQHMVDNEYPSHPNNIQAACMCGLNFVGEEFGVKFTDRWIKNGHSLAPICKQSCLHLWQRGADRIRSSISTFREPHNFNQYIYSWYQHLSDQYIDYTPRQCLTNVKTHSPKGMAAELLNLQNQIVCINDNFLCGDITPYATVCQKAIRKRLKIRD